MLKENKKTIFDEYIIIQFCWLDIHVVAAADGEQRVLKIQR